MEIENKIKELIENVINENGYRLDKVEYILEDGVQFLRISIDKDGVIDVDDCVKVNHLIDPILESEDPIAESYILDICSKENGEE